MNDTREIFNPVWLWVTIYANFVTMGDATYVNHPGQTVG